MVESRLIFVAILVVMVVLLLSWERIKLRKQRKQLPLRICITGTRGKSSVTRLIVGSLREAGMRILAKTTGSKPILIYPDGKETLIRRKGRPNILETKNIINQAVRLGVDVMVTELMSIHPECLYSESVQILDPSILVITNIRPDHQEQWGYSKASIFKAFSCAIPKKCVLFLPEEESSAFFIEGAVPPGVEIKFIAQDLPGDISEGINRLFPYEFKQNIRLALAVAEYLGVEINTALKGMAKARPDFGSLKAWESGCGDPGEKYISISAFAANDPHSAQMVINKIRESGLKGRRKIIGILNLREDRADRTLQWLREFCSRRILGVDRLVLTGAHASAFKRKLKSAVSMEIDIIKERDPGQFLSRILAKDRKEDVLLLGMGNMQGMGSDLVEYWEENGVSYDL